MGENGIDAIARQRLPPALVHACNIVLRLTHRRVRSLDAIVHERAQPRQCDGVIAPSDDATYDDVRALFGGVPLKQEVGKVGSHCLLRPWMDRRHDPEGDEQSESRDQSVRETRAGRHRREKLRHSHDERLDQDRRGDDPEQRRGGSVSQAQYQPRGQKQTIVASSTDRRVPSPATTVAKKSPKYACGALEYGESGMTSLRLLCKCAAQDAMLAKPIPAGVQSSANAEPNAAKH